MDTTKSLERALGLALTTCAANVNALGAGDVLTIETGSYAELGGGTELTAPGYSGDYLIGLDGIRLGEAQTGLPSIDQPWSWTFSPGSTSMHTSTSPINVLSMVGNLVELDFTGWNLNWGGTTQNSSPLGSGAWAGNPEGIAQMQCATDCAYGDTYTLTYSATVPEGHPSSIGGVREYTFLTGRISADLSLNIVPIGGGVQECADVNGHLVDFSADFVLPIDAVLDSIVWSLNGAEFGTGELASQFVSLGSHTVSATINLTDGRMQTANTTIDIVDTTPPDLVVSLLPFGSLPAMTANYVASDICDPAPVSTGMVGGPVTNGEILAIWPFSGGTSSIQYLTTEIEILATATDGSGNTVSATADFIIP